MVCVFFVVVVVCCFAFLVLVLLARGRFVVFCLLTNTGIFLLFCLWSFLLVYFLSRHIFLVFLCGERKRVGRGGSMDAVDNVLVLT